MMPLLVPVLLVPVPVVLLVLLVLLVPPWRCGCRGGPAAGVTMTARLPRQCGAGGPPPTLRRAPPAAPALGSYGSAQRAPPTAQRRHDADGISDDARAVIARHGLDAGRILEIAGRYAAEDGADFNLAPARDFEGALVGRNLASAVYEEPVFDRFRGRFDAALDSLDYGASDAIIDKCLRAGAIVDSSGESICGRRRRDAELLEGLNVALFRAAADAPMLNRFIEGLGELDNYRSGRRRREGNEQDRVSTTVGRSNAFLDQDAAAVVSYSAASLAGWTQPVRYSPYPRSLDAARERFGAEKGGSFAGEGEVHIHARCPIPARDHIKISLLPRCRLGTQDVVGKYGDVGIVV